MKSVYSLAIVATSSQNLSDMQQFLNEAEFPNNSWSLSQGVDVKKCKEITKCTEVVSHGCYSVKETQPGFLRGFGSCPLRLLGFWASYGLDIKCLITLTKVWLFVMCKNEIPKATSSHFAQQRCTQKGFV